jgi:hypothetical protein
MSQMRRDQVPEHSRLTRPACMTKGCLFVWAGYDDEWEPAAPLNEWFAPSKKHATHAAVEGGEGER